MTGVVPITVLVTEALRELILKLRLIQTLKYLRRMRTSFDTGLVILRERLVDKVAELERWSRFGRLE